MKPVMKLRSDIPIKYHVGAHRLCASYPDEIDVLHDIVGHVFASNKRKKAWKPEDIKMKFDGIKDVFPDIGDDRFKEKVKTILAALHKNNDITMADSEGDGQKLIVVTRQGLAKLYEI